MRVEYATKAGMAYIYLADAIAPGEAVRQAIAGNDWAAVLDFDANGQLLGVELSIQRLHPDLLAIAKQIGCALLLAPLMIAGIGPGWPLSATVGDFAGGLL